MSESITLLDFLARFGAVDVAASRVDACIAAALVHLPDDSRVLFLERTYRDGLYLIDAPTEQEVAIFEEGDLWELWNSNRKTWLSAALDGLERP